MSNRKPFIRPGYARCIECSCEVPSVPGNVPVCDSCRAQWEIDLEYEVRLEERQRGRPASRIRAARNPPAYWGLRFDRE